MKKILIFLIIITLLLPSNVLAITESYNDKVSNLVNVKIDEEKVNLYLFYGAECPHCEKERKFLKTIEKKYKDYLNIYYFEVWHDEENSNLMDKVREEFKVTRNSVPLTIIGEDYYLGYSEAIASSIENKLKEYAGIQNSKDIKIPFLGKVNIEEISIPILAVILGFVDGFNPCAMWILLFLINMLFGIKNKKKAWILGLTFLICSGLVYFLSMLGINFIIGVATIKWLKILIAIFILIAGLLNLKKYFTILKEDTGCQVIDSKKRKKLLVQIKKIINSKSFILSFVGITFLAISVNLIELACSLGFPLIFTEILSINNVTGFVKIIYLLIYILFYMLDDIVVFSISMITLELTGITNKYNKLCTLISSIIMIIMGLLLLFKPEWLMLNF